MAGTVYTDYINNSSDSSYGIRGVMPWSTPTTTSPTTSNITVSASFSKKKSFGTTADVSMTIGATGKTSVTGTATNPSSADTKVVISDTTWSFARQQSAYNVTLSVSISLPNSSAYTGTKTGTVSVQIPALPTYSVSFDVQGHGTAPTTQTISHGYTATEPTAPSEQGWEFGGWYTDATCTTPWDFNTSITADRTLYAKWTKESITIYAKQNGSWAQGVVYVKDNGSWVMPPYGYAKVNGSWEDIT